MENDPKQNVDIKCALLFKNELIKIQKLLESMKNDVKIESQNLKKFIMSR